MTVNKKDPVSNDNFQYFYSAHARIYRKLVRTSFFQRRSIRQTSSMKMSLRVSVPRDVDEQIPSRRRFSVRRGISIFSKKNLYWYDRFIIYKVNWQLCQIFRKFSNYIQFHKKYIWQYLQGVPKNKPKMAYSRDLPKMAWQQCGIMDWNCSDT